jgi:hypothetical protein
VTTADITLIRRLILGVSTNFPSGLWRFLPSDEVITDPLKPWTASRMRRYATLAAGMLAGQDFKAIKLGDVNGSWKAPTVAATSLAKSKAKGRLSLGEVSALTGDRVAIPMRAEGLSAVTSMQFSLRWDPSRLEFLEVGGFQLPGLASGNFNSLKVSEGLLSFSWDPQTGEGVNLSELSSLFELRMKVLEKAGGTAAVRWVDEPTPTEVTVDLNPVEIDRVAGWVVVGGGTVGPVVTPESLKLRVTNGGANGVVALEVEAPLGVAVALESSEALGGWAEVASATGAGPGIPIRFSQPVAPNAVAKFWRVRAR